mgnify:CR=1 FL=1
MQTVLDGRYAADRSVVALGMFDGVHIGHQVLLKKGRTLADRQGVCRWWRARLWTIPCS